MCTLRPVARLGVASFHGRRFGFGLALLYPVQVSLSVWTDHLPFPQSRATALGALEREFMSRLAYVIFNQERGCMLIQRLVCKWGVDSSLPGPSLLYASQWGSCRRASHRLVSWAASDGSHMRSPPEKLRLNPHTPRLASVSQSRTSQSTTDINRFEFIQESTAIYNQL